MKVSENRLFLVRLLHATCSADGGFHIEKAKDLLHTHLDSIWRNDILKAEESLVKSNYDRGFSAVCGRDIDGRPLVWVRFKYIFPGKIPLGVGVKSTWLALDAALQDMESIRVGCRLVYDFSGIGLANLAAFKLHEIKEGCLAVACSHPSVISSVLFLDAPHLFRIGWGTVEGVLTCRTFS